MKKLLVSVVLLVSSLCLVGCKEQHIDPPIDIDIDEEYTDSSSNIDVDEEYTDPSSNIDIDGEYYGAYIYTDTTSSVAPIYSRAIVISNNKFIDCNDQFNEIDLKNNFFENSLIIGDSEHPFGYKGEKVLYAQIYENIGYYLFTTKKNLYMYSAAYSEERGYRVYFGWKLTKMEDLKTNLPKVMPEDFSFTITFGFDGSYDSKTGLLKNGYNYDLDVECKTELILTETELKEIYELLKSTSIDKMPMMITVSENNEKPSYNIIISYTLLDETKSITICGASSISLDKWTLCKGLGEAYYTIVNDYIKSSEAFKSLPKNQNLYD